MGSYGAEWIMSEMSSETSTCAFCENRFTIEDSDAEDEYSFCSKMCEDDVKSEKG